MADQTELIEIDAAEVKVVGDANGAPALTASDARRLKPRVIQICVDGVAKKMIIIAGEPF